MRKHIRLGNQIDTDFRAVAIAAELLENGDYETDQICVLPLGPSRRAFAREIESFSFYYSESKLKDCLIISSNEDGFYDILPEGLFHQSPIRSMIFSEEQMIEDVRLRREEERSARKFFSPFEAEVNYMKTLLQWYENRLDKRGDYEDLTDIFAAEWQEFRMFNKDQSAIWMHFLPLINPKRNDLLFMGQLLTILFKLPVEVIRDSVQLKRVKVEDALQFRLGEGMLGTDTILGDSFMSDEEEVLIRLGPCSVDQLLGFTKEHDWMETIELTAAHLLPAETNFHVDFRFREEEKKAELGSESPYSVLGQTFFL